jgi:spore coat protein U-like protein
MSPARLIAGMVAVWLTLAAVPSQAATTRPFVVSASIVNGCAVGQAGGSWGKINFGTVSAIATGTLDANLSLAGVSGLSVECTPGVAATLTADNGNNALSGQRRMVQTGVTPGVPYALFANGSSTPWTTQSIALSFPTGTTKQLFAIKGRATLPAPLRAGKYVDTVRITITW